MNNHTIKRVLVIRSGALGETIFALPVVDALRAQYGDNVRIDWVGTPAASALFKLDFRIGTVFPLKHRKLPIILSREKQAILRHSKKSPYDILINLESGTIFTSLVKKIRAKQKLGMPYNQIGKPDERELHEHPHAIESLRTLYASIIEPDILNHSYPTLFGEDKTIVAQKFSLPENYVVLNPCTSHFKKFDRRAWPLEHWKNLIKNLSKNYTVVVTGGKNEESFFQKLRPFPSSVIDLSGKTSLPELIGVIRDSQGIITADTGPSHIGSAVNARVFVLIGSSFPQGTGAFVTPTNHIHIISKNLECSPCNGTPRFKACLDNQCMKQILPSEVEAIVKPFLTPKE